MKDKSLRFLLTGLLFAIAICVALSCYLNYYMDRESVSTIDEIGQTYMSSLDNQIALHFETIISMQLKQARTLLDTVKPRIERGEDVSLVLEQLKENAKNRGFEYVALCAQDGTLDMIYGDQLELVAPEPYMDSVKNGDDKVTVGNDKEGKRVFIISVPFEYSLQNGVGESVAFVVGLPMTYLAETLSLNDVSQDIYSFVIRRDGSFVIRTSDEFRTTYYDRVHDLYDEVSGMTPDEYIVKLKAAMDSEKKYETDFVTQGERRRVYLTNVPYSEWYLLNFVSYGKMDATIERFSRQWSIVSILVCIVLVVMFVVIFIIYFTMMKRRIQMLAKARQEAENASRAKSEFLSNMSHDIRTPMNAIVGMTSIALSDVKNSEQTEDCLKKISLSSKHLLGLINDVLDMAKIESGRMTLTVEAVSLRDIMDNIVAIVQQSADARNQNFNVYIYDVFAENVYCDSVRLHQILINLLSNAIKFTPEGGKVQIALHEEEIADRNEYVRVHIHVIDNGIGMSDEFRKQIFNSFAREDERVRTTEGSGLGMTITKYIVDAMGGSIEVKSELGKGSEFHVTLDLEKVRFSDAEMKLPPWTVLIVDDESRLCESVSSSLKTIGVNSEWALSGAEALKMVEKRHETLDDYDMILLDWKLPDMNGIETARRVREIVGDNIPVLLTSAYDWGNFEKQAREAGINDFISKPLFKSTLYHALVKYVEGEKAKENDKPVSLDGKRVLLAEDNELNREIAQVLLEDIGLVLECAENGQICVDMFSDSAPGYYDAILMDIRMPIMTGYEATKAIRALDRPDAASIPIIAMTADAFAEDVKRSLDSGMNAHVAKPIDIGKLSQILEKFIGEKE